MDTYYQLSSMSTVITVPDTQIAVVANALGDLIITHHALVPEPAPDQILLKTVTVAVNPVDVKLTGPMASEHATAGSDCAGIVVAIGSDAQADGRFTIGDRVCAASAPMNPLAPHEGAWAEYVTATADFALKVPDDMPLDSAAGLGIGMATTGYALFRSLAIPGHPERPVTEPKRPIFVLVYGGSTASGTLAIQLIRK